MQALTARGTAGAEEEEMKKTKKVLKNPLTRQKECDIINESPPKSDGATDLEN